MIKSFINLQVGKNVSVLPSKDIVNRNYNFINLNSYQKFTSTAQLHNLHSAMRSPQLLGLLALLATPLLASMADTLVREEWEVGRGRLGTAACGYLCLGLEGAARKTVQSRGGRLQNENLDGQQRED